MPVLLWSDLTLNFKEEGEVEHYLINTYANNAASKDSADLCQDKAV